MIENTSEATGVIEVIPRLQIQLLITDNWDYTWCLIDIAISCQHFANEPIIPKW